MGVFDTATECEQCDVFDYNKFKNYLKNCPVSYGLVCRIFAPHEYELKACTISVRDQIRKLTVTNC